MNNNIIIYGSTIEIANAKLQGLLDNMKYGDVLNVMKSFNNFVVTMKNGDVYRAVTTSDSSRGRKWQYAYIDSKIDSQLIDWVVLPCFMPKNLNDRVADCANWY